MPLSPLYDIYDPTGSIRQGVETDIEYDAFGNPIKRKPRLEDLMPEEEQDSLLNDLAHAGTSGLATAGYVFDTPGSFIRGLLAGKPTSVAGNSEERVTGRDLLRQYGLIGDQDTWGNFFAGLATEILTDPLTYGTFGLSALFKGAKTGAGLAAEGAGLLRNVGVDAGARGVRNYLRSTTPRQALDAITDPTLRTAAEESLQAQFKRFGLADTAMDDAMGAFDTLSIPGTNIRYSYDLGPLGEAVANFGDKVAAGTRTMPGIGHARAWLSSAFDKKAGEYYNGQDLEMTNLVQDLSRRKYKYADDQRYLQNLQNTALQRTAMQAQVPEVFPASAGPLAGQAIPEHLRDFRNVKLRQAIRDSVQGNTGDEMADWVIDNVDEFSRVRDAWASLGREAADAATAVGLPTNEWTSLYDTPWLPRQLKQWQDPDFPVLEGTSTPQQRAWSRAQKVLGTQDNFGRRRNVAYDLPGGDRTFTELTGGAGARQLQEALANAPRTDWPKIIDDAVRGFFPADPLTGAAYGGGAFDKILELAENSQQYLDAGPASQKAMSAAAREKMRQAYSDLGELLRDADRNFASTGTGVFDSDPWDNILRYQAGQIENNAAARVVRETLEQNAIDQAARDVTGGANISLAKAAKSLGFDKKAFGDIWKASTGATMSEYSVPERVAEALKVLAPRTSQSLPAGAITSAVDNVTNMLKGGMLAWPSFHARNITSGLVNAATHGGFNLLDFYASLRASGGNYDALARRLEGAPGYVEDVLGAPMSAADRVAKYLDQTGATQVVGASAVDDVGGAAEDSLKGMFLGADSESIARKVLDSAYQPGRTWPEWLRDMTSMRGVGFLQPKRRTNTNPILVMNDALGGRAEDALRGMTFLNQVRKGVDPRRAADISYLSNVDYRPQAFTDFEKGLKRLVPFYSFQKGILPSIATNIIERPGGLQQNIIRATVRGSEPGEDNFLPEDMRRSAAIELPDLLSSGNPDLKRYLTGTDMPWEWLFNLATPGTGATVWSRAANTLQNFGSNLLGMTNPIIKAPIEFATGRQLYSGRDMADLYSVLERDLGAVGRPLEQVLMNFVPFGARGVGLYRQLTDDRMSMPERLGKLAFNNLTGQRVKDINAMQAKDRAARDMMKDIMQSAPGAHSFENIDISEEDLIKLPPDQQRVYLLYKIIQQQAAARARQRKKAEALLAGSV